MPGRYFLLTTLLCLLLIGRVSSQSVIPNRIALRKALSKQDAGYSMRPDDERYEGFYNKEKGEEDFSVFSLLKGKLDYVMSGKEKLIIIAPKIPGVDSAFIAGASFNFWPDYRLDIHLKSGDEAHVPLNAAIKTKNLFKDHLGIYGYTGLVGSPICYIPVEVRSSVNAKNNSEYVLTLISIKSVADVTWDYLPANSGLLTEPTVGDDTIASVSERSPITIPLKFKQKFAPGTTVIIQVWGKINGGKSKERLQKLKIIIPKA